MCNWVFTKNLLPGYYVMMRIHISHSYVTKWIELTTATTARKHVPTLKQDKY